ncbi:hypothetical protein D3C80_1014590 [compost metagenome]
MGPGAFPDKPQPDRQLPAQQRICLLAHTHQRVLFGRVRERACIHHLYHPVQWTLRANGFEHRQKLVVRHAFSEATMDQHNPVAFLPVIAFQARHHLLDIFIAALYQQQAHFCFPVATVAQLQVIDQRFSAEAFLCPLFFVNEGIRGVTVRESG